jgi:hypothetical protein
MRKQTRRKVVIPMPPRCFRSKLTPSQITELGICHWAVVDAIQSGKATPQEMWSMAGAALTWSRIAEMLGTGTQEMRAQLELVYNVIDRFKRTGRVGFSGPEYQLAKAGAGYMDDLAALVDKPTAVIAAEWSEAEVQRMAA